MEVIRLCRLCLTFSEYHANIFFEKIKDKELWRLVNSVCQLNTFLYDGLPEHICVDCVETLKKMLSFRNRAIEATSALKLMIQRNKDLWEKSEWDASKSSKAAPKAVKVEILEGTKALVQPPVATPPSTRSTRQTTVNKSTRSSDLRNFPGLEASEETSRNTFEGESSSICTSQDNSIEIRDTNKMINEKDLRADVVTEEESEGLSRSILNDTKSDHSHLKAPLSKRKSGLICDICKKSFKRKQNLGNHVRVHNKERPFSCNKCDKTFKWDIGRYRHELRHVRDKMSLEKGTKEMLYSCDLCAKNFSSKSQLYRHSNLHRNKYKCNTCGKCFGESGILMTHLTTHTKEKPFKCEVCFKCFNRKGVLNTHLLSHSSDKPFLCDICDKGFKSKAQKNVHALTHLRKK